MMRRDSRAPGPQWIDEQTPNHAIGGLDEVILVVAFRGASDDPRHIQVTSQAIDRLFTRLRQPVRLLFAMPEATTSKPPSPAVREVLGRTVEHAAARLARVSLVVQGDGFGAAVHRATIASFTPFIRAGFPVRVSGTVPEGLDYLVGPGLRADALQRLYEDLLATPR